MYSVFNVKMIAGKLSEVFWSFPDPPDHKNALQIKFKLSSKAYSLMAREGVC